jgi:Short C-terminal domain
VGLIGGMARTAVVAGTATAVSNRVSRRQGNRWAQKDQAAYDQQYAQQQQYAQPVYAAPPPAPAAPAGDDMPAQLEKLAQLHTNGVLSDDEFAAAKAKVLGV